MPLLTIIVFLVSGSPQAENVSEGTSLVTLRSRIFDLKVDATRIPRDDHFIPLTRVRWIERLLKNDDNLYPTVIHIDSTQRGSGRYVWRPDVAEERYTHTEGLPAILLIDGYDVRWQSSSLPTKRGTVLLVPKGERDDFYASCAYDKSEQLASFCSVTVSYPPDKDLRIRVRIYKITNPINDFRAIAHKARALVYCLDVTEQIRAGNWAPKPDVDPNVALPDLLNCK